MTDQPSVTFNDGATMPQIGMGTAYISDEEALRVVAVGLRVGYRAVDTASIYGTESGAGRSVRESGERVFVTTKLWNDDQGRDGTRAAFERSLATLGLDRIDLYLIHWPQPARGLYLETWKALVEMRSDERLGSIGVSNFTVRQLEEIIDATGVVPAVNQIELHPAFAQDELVAFHRERGIVTTSWSPLGHGASVSDPVIGRLAAKHGRSPAQVIVRWHLERGLSVIPRSSSEARLRDNLAVTDFALDEEDMAAIAGLDRPDGRIGPDPEVF